MRACVARIILSPIAKTEEFRVSVADIGYLHDTELQLGKVTIETAPN